MPIFAIDAFSGKNVLAGIFQAIALAFAMLILWKLTKRVALLARLIILVCAYLFVNFTFTFSVIYLWHG